MSRVAACALLAVMAIAPPLAAQQTYQYESYTLPNGLHVVLSEDHSSAVAAVNIWYDVGSRHEKPGRSGFAHLFEHMMFQGSANVAKAELFQLVERAGGSNNGTTNEDRTAYYEIMPSNRLNLALWLEADRMRSLAITDENFENQRETVKEERRMRVDNQPYTKAFVEGLTMPFDSTTCFGYSHSVIGSMDDLNAAKTADVQEFFNLYYAPSNATLVVVGDFDPGETKQLIEDYFGDIPTAEQPEPLACEVAYGSLGRREVFPDQFAKLPAVITAYLVPPHKDDDTPALTLLADIMGSGESSRLNIALVREAQSALQAGAALDSRTGPGLFYALGIANQGVDIETLEQQLAQEIARVGAEGITEAELTKAKNSFKSSQIFGRQTAFGLSNSLQHYALYHDSIDEINTDTERYLAVTLDDIKRVANTYLVPDNALTLLVVPAEEAGAEEGGAQ